MTAYTLPLLLDDQTAPPLPQGEDEWTFNGAPTRDLTHCYHDYPARMIPQIARRLLTLFGADAKRLFDPYCGTGTSLVEGMVHGLAVIGTDLNPLARLIATAKTTPLAPAQVNEAIEQWSSYLHQQHDQGLPIPEQITGIERLEFWFKPKVIHKLTLIRTYIATLDCPALRRFFEVAFSETVRDCSNTRNNEFKLYRLHATALHAFDPDVYSLFMLKLKRNLLGLQAFVKALDGAEHTASAQIMGFNTIKGIPGDAIVPDSIDLVVTSPPYGDSHTTVAYGQYSRLSAAWLGLDEPAKVDSRLMGGTKQQKIQSMLSEPLNHAIESIRQSNEKRAREVSAFYVDLDASIHHVASVIRSGGHACYVVGNRKVKGIVLPTDDAVRCCFTACGFDHIETFTRSIPNKRMPLKNSPSNVVGASDVTMHREYIVVMRKR